MKVLWTINILPSFPAQQLCKDSVPIGGWIFSMAQEIIKHKNVELAMVSLADCNTLKKYKDEKLGIVYYVIPGKYGDLNYKQYTSDWNAIIKDFSPDIVHLHGTEYNHTLPLFELERTFKIVISIQGLVSECAKYYRGDLSSVEVISCLTLHDLIRGGIMKSQKEYYKRGKYEISMLKQADVIVGRTDWDYAVIESIEQKDKYKKCNEILRDSFYSEHGWEYEKCEKFTIFCSQANYPIKGFHILLKSLIYVKQMFPDVKIRVAGNNLLDNSGINKRLRRVSYSKYIERLIKQYNLLNNIEFCGKLDEQNMVREYLNANVFIQTSIIENSPNSLGEAMLLGVPCIASFVGGTANFIEHGNNGYLFPFQDEKLLAYYIERIFNNPDEAILLGKRSKEKAKKIFNPSVNAKNMFDIYNNIERQWI